MRPAPKRMSFFDFDVDPIWIYLALLVAAGVLLKLAWTLVLAL